MTSSAPKRLVVLLVAMLAPATILAQVSRPESHTVRTGDTLWDLAQQYLGDPLLWPEIYRLNTTVVEDPHWIYPGEVLRLVAGGDMSAVPATDTPLPEAGSPTDTSMMADAPAQDAADAAPSDAAEDAAMPDLAEPQVMDMAESSDSGFRRDDVDLTPLVGDHRRLANTGPTIESSLRQAYRPLRRTEFYSSGFLTEYQPLPLGKLLGLVTPLTIEEVSAHTTAQLFSKIAVTPPAGGKYQVGDTLLVVEPLREISGYGDVMLPTGLVRIIDVSRPEALGEVIAAYGSLQSGNLVLPAEAFSDPGNVRAVPISDGITGKVLGQRELQPLTGPQDVIFIDRGRKDGVALGDIFELRQRPRERVDGATVINEVMATVQVVHVGDHSATARVTKVTQPDIPPGTEVRQIAKLPT